MLLFSNSEYCMLLEDATYFLKIHHNGKSLINLAAAQSEFYILPFKYHVVVLLRYCEIQ